MTNVCQVRCEWISQACARQRRGRAGRSQPGVCFHLFSSRRYRTLPPDQTPEILREPLQVSKASHLLSRRESRETNTCILSHPFTFLLPSFGGGCDNVTSKPAYEPTPVELQSQQQGNSHAPAMRVGQASGAGAVEVCRLPNQLSSLICITLGYGLRLSSACTMMGLYSWVAYLGCFGELCAIFKYVRI